MPDVHYEVDEGAEKNARDLMDAMRSLRNSWDKLSAVRGSMVRQQISENSNDEVFAQVAVNFAFEGADTATKQANAAGAFAEIDGNWSTVDAKIEQMLNSFL